MKKKKAPHRYIADSEFCTACGQSLKYNAGYPCPEYVSDEQREAQRKEKQDKTWGKSVHGDATK